MGKVYGTFALTGSDSLASYDGNTLNDGDACIVFTDDTTRIYNLDWDSGEEEKHPYIVAPFRNAANKRWKLVSGGSLWIPKTQNFVAIAGERYLIDTSLGEIQMTLPENPINGEWIKVCDAWDFSINKITILKNGNTIMKVNEDMNVDTSTIPFDLVFYNGDWRIA